jgi:predicted phosphodiesterase
MKSYNEIEARELYLYTINCGNIYRAKTQNYLNNLKKKAAKGEYDQKQAAKGFEAIAALGSKQYEKDFGSDGDHIFSPADRKEAAVRMELYYRDGVLKG